MATVNDVTSNLLIPIPNAGNQIVFDIGRLRDAITTIDGFLNTHATAISARELSANKGVANGYAPLGSDSKVPAINLPDSIVGQLEYQGGRDMSVTLPTATAENHGFYYITTVAGNSYNIGDWAVSNGTTWDKIDNTDAVFSVSGRIGAVTLTSSDVSLENVDNVKQLPNIQTLVITGDATASSTALNTGTIALTLATSGVTAGTVNNAATSVTPFTVNAKGLVTDTGTAVTITPAFSSLTSVPTTVAGYGITNAYTKTEVDTAITNGTPSFTTLTGKPTTLLGYGITDATTSTAFTTHTGDAALHLTTAQNTFIDAVTATSTEVNYLVGVTSAIQTQLGTKLTKSGAVWSDFT